MVSTVVKNTQESRIRILNIYIFSNTQYPHILHIRFQNVRFKLLLRSTSKKTGAKYNNNRIQTKWISTIADFYKALRENISGNYII